ncbi:hypothetical protein ATKI12_6952 [Kitasatospora sp. Ki12]
MNSLLIYIIGILWAAGCAALVVLAVVGLARFVGRLAERREER